MEVATRTEENISINQALNKSIQNSKPSLNYNILITVHNSGRNLASELNALGLEVENEDPLHENMAHDGTLNCAVKPADDWITSLICPCAQENCPNIYGKFSVISWKIVS